jgi:hypothetical protein
LKVFQTGCAAAAGQFAAPLSAEAPSQIGPHPAPDLEGSTHCQPTETTRRAAFSGPQVSFQPITIDGGLLRRGTIGVENACFSDVQPKLPQKDRDFS